MSEPETREEMREYIEQRGWTAVGLLDGLQRQQVFQERLNELEDDEELNEPDRTAIEAVRNLSMF